MTNNKEANDKLQTVKPVANKRRRFIRQTAAATTLAVIPASLQALAGTAAVEATPAKGYAANNPTGILSHWVLSAGLLALMMYRLKFYFAVFVILIFIP